MCGRFSSTSQLQFLLEQFRAEPLGVEGHQPSWNVAPASDILVVVAGDDGARQLRELRWGLVPRWAKDTKGRPLINMRAETVREKPTWQRTLARKRCIIPIDGFYEWQDQGKGQRKQPFYITSRDFSPLALAGLWATWRDPSAGKDEQGDGDDRAWHGRPPQQLRGLLHDGGERGVEVARRRLGPHSATASTPARRRQLSSYRVPLVISW